MVFFCFFCAFLNSNLVPHQIPLPLLLSMPPPLITFLSPKRAQTMHSGVWATRYVFILFCGFFLRFSSLVRQLDPTTTLTLDTSALHHLLNAQTMQTFGTQGMCLFLFLWFLWAFLTWYFTRSHRLDDSDSIPHRL